MCTRWTSHLPHVSLIIHSLVLFSHGRRIVIALDVRDTCRGSQLVAHFKNRRDTHGHAVAIGHHDNNDNIFDDIDNGGNWILGAIQSRPLCPHRWTCKKVDPSEPGDESYVQAKQDKVTKGKSQKAQSVYPAQMDLTTATARRA